LPFSIVGDSAGMRILVAINHSPTASMTSTLENVRSG
jgi:hypothetical protein